MRKVDTWPKLVKNLGSVHLCIKLTLHANHKDKSEYRISRHFDDIKALT